MQQGGGSASNEAQKQLALLCLGEVGQQQDLSAIPNLKEILLGGFESASEDTKLSAAYALGHVAVGNMRMFLPIILQASSSSKHQYLLLVSLKELVVVFANQQLDFAPHLGAALPLLLQQCQSEEDSVRSMVAECLGVLTTILPAQVLPVLLQLNSNSTAADTLSRRMIAHALRFSLSRSASSPAALDAITQEMHQFLPLLKDEDLDVKKAALLMVNTAVHHNPRTVEAHIGAVVIPALIETLQTKLERIVDLGPFKHRVSSYHFHLVISFHTVSYVFIPFYASLMLLPLLPLTLILPLSTLCHITGGRLPSPAQDLAHLSGDAARRVARAPGPRLSGAGDAPGAGGQGRAQDPGAPGGWCRLCLFC